MRGLTRTTHAVLDLRFEPPDVPVFAVARDRLVALLDLAFHRRVTIVVAPPGYGKTVLLAQWAASNPRQRTRWITITAGDNDVGHLVGDLVGALQSPSHPLREPILAGPGVTDRGMGPGVLADLLEELEGMPPVAL